MKIAVIICGLVFDSQKALMKGIERKIRDLKDTCSVFCVHGNLTRNDDFSDGEHTIFDLPDISKFDGLIYVKNTFVGTEAELPKLLEEVKRKKIPTVCIDSYDEDFVNIGSDEKLAMKELTEHMIVEHGCRSFTFVAGAELGTDASLRYQGFREALSEHNLPFEEDHRYIGNYEYQSGVAAAKEFIAKGRPFDDCIMCSNDQMAVGVYVELKKNGIRVPKDVKLTGVDYDFVSRAISTKLTTIKRQQYQKGLKAVDILHHIEEHEIGENIISPVILSIGESCGCKCKDENHGDVDDTLAVDRYEQSELTQYIKEMTVAFMSRQQYLPLIEEMKKFALRMKPKELYLCMNVRPEVKIDYTDFFEEVGPEKEENSYSDEMVNVISVQNGQLVPAGEHFSRENLFPAVAGGGREGVTYYFLPIHYLKRNFGYAIIGESGDLVRNDFFPNWTTSVSNAFENNRKIDLMGQMIEVLDKMWIYDTLTGIYNRAGFFKLSEPIVNECIRDHKPICVIFLDVDGLKIVNDTYGHDAGDQLIKDVANVLKGVKKHGEIIMRYGGDEFVLMAAGYDDKRAEQCINEIEIAMENLNARVHHPYTVEASSGYTITNIENAGQLNTIIEDADQEMYKVKYIKKASRSKKQ